MYDFSLVKTDDESIYKCLEILKKVFPKNKKFSFEYLKWLYTNNPAGDIVGYNAFYNNSIVAHYVAMPIIAEYNGLITKGLLSLNTATAPEHQGRGLFIRLAELTYEYAFNNGFKFVCGVANANSTHGFINKMGFRLITPLITKIGFGSLHFKEHQPNYILKRFWDDVSLKWRLSNPSFDYWKENNFINSKSGYFGVNAIIGKINNINSEYIKEIKNPLIKSMPKLYIGIDQNIVWKNNYYDIPIKFRPVPLNFVFKDFDNSTLSIEKENVLFQAIDFDIY
jgi:GNAT superfamily N-acetyltransferase